MTHLRILPAALLWLAVAPLAAGCDSEAPMPESADPANSRSVMVWLAADKDAHVQCTTSIDCADGTMNFGEHGGLQIAAGPATKKRAYVHFHLPELPPGTIVEEAYVELYHSTTMEDATSDNRCFSAASVVDDWDPLALTWEDQPNAIQMSPEFSIALRSSAWSGSNDIAPIVQPLVDDPDVHQGFVVWPDSEIEQYEKELISNNAFGRDATELRDGPRLLVRMELPPDTMEEDVVLPELPDDNDLPFDGEEVLMAQWAFGDAWPDDWDVTVGKNDHYCQNP